MRSDHPIPFPEPDGELTIPRRFEQVVDAVPDCIALTANGVQISYAELDDHANRIAHIARSIVSGDDPIAATFLEHEPQQIATLLGLLKANIPYVVIDPSTTEATTRHILSDSKAALLVTTGGAERKLAPITDEVPILNLDKLNWSEPVSRMAVPHDGNATAYLVYTSGSTGVPKGVIKTHHAMLYTTHVAVGQYSISLHDRLSSMISMSFAASRFSFLGALLNGARLCLYDLRRDGLEGLARWIGDEQITLLHVLPSTLRAAFGALDKVENLDSVRSVVVGGEPLTRSDLHTYKRHFPTSCRLVNTYAATETGVISRIVLDHQTEYSEEILPVGYPVKGAEVMIAPAAATTGEPEVGELLVRGTTLSPGYWRDKTLTHQRFSGDPDSRKEWTYHSGDIGKIDADGCLWVFGRLDQQVKIHGQRFQLEALESALERHPGIRAAAATVDAQRKRPVVHAFVQIVPGDDPADADLRAWLSDRLPHAIIPSVFHRVDMLPRTVIGKVDRTRLDVPAAPDSTGRPEIVAPADRVESDLLEIWEQVLQIHPLSVEDDYFEIGGDSLAATTLFSRIERAFGVRLPMASLFRAPTIATQAALIRQGGERGRWPAMVAVQPLGSRPPIFCVSPLVVDVLAYRELALQIGLNQPFFALYAHQDPSEQDQPPQVEEKAREYIHEMRQVQPQGPYTLCGYSNGGKIAFEMAVQLAAEGERVQRLILLETYGPDYLQREASVRRNLIRRLVVIRHLQRSLNNFVPWLFLHLRTLASLDWVERWDYIRLKADHRLQMLKAGIQRQYSRLLRLSQPDQALYKTPASRAVYAYQPQVYAGDATIIRAKNQLIGVRPDPFLGWREYITGDVSLAEVPGYHDSILFGPRVSTLALRIREAVGMDPLPEDVKAR